ncbi:MAG: hypothetical protein ACC652_06250 [Acidimicrobiales bacterium]
MSENAPRRLDTVLGPGTVIRQFTGPETHQLMLDAYGESGIFGLSPEEFPASVNVAALDAESLAEIFNWEEILDLYSAAELGL